MSRDLYKLFPGHPIEPCSLYDLRHSREVRTEVFSSFLIAVTPARVSEHHRGVALGGSSRPRGTPLGYKF